MAGCSVSMPIASIVQSKPDPDDVTGSIPKSRLIGILDPEDWRRAKAALATALDPQGNGSPVNWDNPDTGSKGTFIPVGKAYPFDGQVCRAFTAQIERKNGPENAVRGTACADKGGEWALTELNAGKKGRG
jgi:surface antigen